MPIAEFRALQTRVLSLEVGLFEVVVYQPPRCQLSQSERSRTVIRNSRARKLIPESGHRFASTSEGAGHVFRLKELVAARAHTPGLGSC
jgi:hypothetical protein